MNKQELAKISATATVEKVPLHQFKRNRIETFFAVNYLTYKMKFFSHQIIKPFVKSKSIQTIKLCFKTLILSGFTLEINISNDLEKIY